MKTTYTLVSLALIISISGCGGQTTQLLAAAAGPAKVHLAQAYNPSAPSIEVPDLSTALEAAPYRSSQLVSYTTLDRLNQPDLAMLDAIQLDETGTELTISLNSSLPAMGVYLAYDATNYHLESATINDPSTIGLAIEYAPGQIAVGITGIAGQPLTAGSALASLSFAPGPSTVVRSASAAPLGSRNEVDDLAAADNDNGSATLQWQERNTGDYDLNSEVNIADLTPIGANFLKTYTESSSEYAQLEVVDGDENGEINIAEITPIGANFGAVIAGYNLYRIPLTDPEEVPVVGVGEWVKVENLADPSGPSAPREFNQQNFRLSYSFIDNSDFGIFGWYVAPTDHTGAEGPASNVITLAVGGLFEGPWLQIIVQDPDDGAALKQNDEFWVGVVVHDVEGLFSANVRLEYDSQLIEYVEAFPAYTDVDTIEHVNLLVPPLFLPANDLAEPDRYKLLGFNSTQTQGTATKDGDGAVGYVKFRAVNTGGNPEAIRFPQSSSLIFLWGEQYGVPLVEPVGLAGPVNLSITD